MGLERFKVEGNIIHPIVGIGFINFLLTVVVLIMSATVFAKPSGIEMELSSFREGINPSGQEVVIAVTGENVIYVNGRVVTLNELRRFLAEGNFRGGALTVKVDRLASMGRLADILDLCRGISGASVNVSTIL